MTEEVLEMKIKAEHASYLYNIGAIDREEAKKEIMPYLNKVNEKALELAKKYHQKPKKVTFSTFIR